PPGRDDGLVQQGDPFRDGPPPRPRPPRDTDEDEPEERPRRSFGPIVKAAVLVLVLLGVAGLVYSQRGLISEFVQAFRGSPTKVGDTKTGTQPSTQQGRPKITDRLGSQDAQPGPAVAQRVVLYEEEPNDPQGKRFVGSAIWR